MFNFSVNLGLSGLYGRRLFNFSERRSVKCSGHQFQKERKY